MVPAIPKVPEIANLQYLEYVRDPDFFAGREVSDVWNSYRYLQILYIRMIYLIKPDKLDKKRERFGNSYIYVTLRSHRFIFTLS